MAMNKKGGSLFIFFVVLVIAGGGIGVYYWLRDDPATNSFGSGSTDFDAEWSAMQNLIAATEARDEGQVNSLSYYGMDDCLADSAEEMCWAIRDALGGIMNILEKSDITKVKKDSKQTVLFTDSTIENIVEGDPTLVTVYFAKKDGSYIVAGIQGISIDDPSAEELIDSDEDGLRDLEEDCSGSGCTDTDPNNMDTDGDSWWDGVEDAAQTDPNDADSYLFREL